MEMAIPPPHRLEVIMKTEHLDIKCWTDYAAGTVDGCYPNPVEANSILELAAFEASDHGAGYVSLSLSNKYNSGYMGEDMKYIPAKIGSLGENEFSTVTGKMNESILEYGKVHFIATKRYLFDKVFEASAPSVTELLLKLAAAKVSGSLSVYFYNYPNGPRCHSEVVRHFNICL